MARIFIVLDRDGTIIEERHHLARTQDVALIPGAGAALRKMTELGLGLVIITNQSAVGRGLLSLETLECIHERIRDLLAEYHVCLDGMYFCPHAPEENCECRKPRTHLAERAARELEFFPSEGWVVGDNASDIEMGRRLGSATILVRTGHGTAVEATAGSLAHYVVDDLGGAAEVIEKSLGNTAGMVARLRERKQS